MKSDKKPVDIAKRRKRMENLSLAGLILLCVGLVVPFANIGSETLQTVFKYVYAAGALIYTFARMVNVNSPGDSMRLKRLRRMEMWAGITFLVGAFFWFYNSARFPNVGFSLVVMRDTIMFTLAGAIIQVIASWMIAARMNKEAKEASGADKDKKR
ncbi:MAG: hypothetical protein K2J23_03325 [Muribaculaceae bacterium]|nr:hypothetical protein [Muribaculaceae bacterium]MDE6866405.1 hypothetical protein [Muribaculaceae bacterium]